MPTYPFRCDDCGFAFDLLRARGQRDAPAPCPGCGEARTRRLMAACNIRSSDAGGSSRSLSGDACASCQSDACATCARR